MSFKREARRHNLKPLRAGSFKTPLYNIKDCKRPLKRLTPEIKSSAFPHPGNGEGGFKPITVRAVSVAGRESEKPN